MTYTRNGSESLCAPLYSLITGRIVLALGCLSVWDRTK